MKKEYETPEFLLHRVVFEDVLSASKDENYSSQIDDPEGDPFS